VQEEKRAENTLPRHPLLLVQVRVTAQVRSLLHLTQERGMEKAACGTFPSAVMTTLSVR
jgi:hypothetical protein